MSQVLYLANCLLLCGRFTEHHNKLNRSLNYLMFMAKLYAPYVFFKGWWALQTTILLYIFSLKETKVFAANSAEEIGVDAHGLILSVWSANCNASLILVSFFSWFGWWSMCEALMTRTWGSCGGRQVQGMVMDTRLTLIPTASIGDCICSTSTSRLFSRFPAGRKMAEPETNSPLPKQDISTCQLPRLY